MGEKTVTAKEIVEGAGAKISQYKVRLVKSGSRRYAVDRISSSLDLLAIARMEFKDLPHEEVIVIGLSGTNQPLGVVRVAQGGIHGAALIPGDVLRPLVIIGATAFVIAHNHPSGDPRPSREDLELTRMLKSKADCAGIHLLDHLIVGGRGGGWASMRELNMIPH